MTTPNPVEIDTALADLYYDEVRLVQRLQWATSKLHSAAGDRLTYVSRKYKAWGMTDAEAAEAGPAKPWDADDHAAALAELAELHAEAAANQAAQAELESVFAAGPWSRFFLVRDGHIHSSTSCSTCFPTTVFGWLPELSGSTEAEALAQHGAWLCTICFPSAPVEYTNAADVAAAEKASSECAGSRTRNYDRSTARTGYVTGNYGVCDHCHERVTLTKTGALRAHKAVA